MTDWICNRDDLHDLRCVGTKRGFLSFEAGSQGFDPIQRLLVGQLACQFSQMPEFLVDLVTPRAHR